MYRSRDLDREVLLSLEEGDLLLLLVFSSTLGGGDFETLLLSVFGFFSVSFTVAFFAFDLLVSECALLLLEALLLRDELPEELLELLELDREPERDREALELPLLLTDDELEDGLLAFLFALPRSLSLSRALPRAGLRLRDLSRRLLSRLRLRLRL